MDYNVVRASYGTAWRGVAWLTMLLNIFIKKPNHISKNPKKEELVRYPRKVSQIFYLFYLIAK